MSPSFLIPFAYRAFYTKVRLNFNFNFCFCYCKSLCSSSILFFYLFNIFTLSYLYKKYYLFVYIFIKAWVWLRNILNIYVYRWFMIPQQLQTHVLHLRFSKLNDLDIGMI